MLESLQEAKEQKSKHAAEENKSGSTGSFRVDGKLIAEATIALLPFPDSAEYVFLFLSRDLLDLFSTNSIASQLERPEPWNTEFIPAVMDKMGTASDKSNHGQQFYFAREEKMSQEIAN